MEKKSVNKIAIVVAIILMCVVILGAFIFFKQKNGPMPDDEINWHGILDSAYFLWIPMEMCTVLIRESV